MSLRKIVATLPWFILGWLLVLVIVVAETHLWSFYLGGHFHPLGGWRGKGTFRSSVAGEADYTMWIQFDVTGHGRSGSTREHALEGSAVLCSPGGRMVPFWFEGSLLRTHGTDLTGVPIHLHFHVYPGTPSTRLLQLDLYGAFGDDVLEVEDRGSIGTAFLPDGSVRASPAETPHNMSSIRATFVKSDQPAGCIASC
jgi:hypothetical protein